MPGYSKNDVVCGNAVTWQQHEQLRVTVPPAASDRYHQVRVTGTTRCEGQVPPAAGDRYHQLRVTGTTSCEWQVPPAVSDRYHQLRGTAYTNCVLLKLWIEHCFWRFTRFARLSLWWVRSTGGMTMTGENRNAGRETCHSDTLSTRKLKWIRIVMNPELRGEMSATTWAKAWALKTKISQNYI